MLKDILYYILSKTGKLSNARITKLIYLSDWKASLSKSKQLTDIEWYFDFYGPFVDNIEIEVKENSDIFNIIYETNSYGNTKKYFSIKGNYHVSLSKDEESTLDFIISKTNDLDFNHFIKFVYSTYPIYKSRKFTQLNLIKLADEYKNLS